LKAKAWAKWTVTEERKESAMDSAELRAKGAVTATEMDRPRVSPDAALTGCEATAMLTEEQVEQLTMMAECF
jgi:hypothetical protein